MRSPVARTLARAQCLGALRLDAKSGRPDLKGPIERSALSGARSTFETCPVSATARVLSLDSCGRRFRLGLICGHTVLHGQPRELATVVHDYLPTVSASNVALRVGGASP